MGFKKKILEELQNKQFLRNELILVAGLMHLGSDDAETSLGVLNMGGKNEGEMIREENGGGIISGENEGEII